MSFNFVLTAFLALAPVKQEPMRQVDARWIAIPASQPACWYQEKAIRCDEKTVQLKTPLRSPPRSFDGVTLLALTDEKIAPELSPLKDLVSSRPRLWLSLTDLALPEDMGLPADLHVPPDTSFAISYASPWIVISTGRQFSWRSPEGAATWRTTDGEFVSFLDDSRVLVFDGESSVFSLELRTGQKKWTVGLPVEGPQTVRAGERRGVLQEIVIDDQTFWFNVRLATWVHQASLPNSVAHLPTCPRPHPQLPVYQTQAAAGAELWCLDYRTLLWKKQTQKSSQVLGQKVSGQEVWGTDDLIRFWSAWLTQVGRAKDISIRPSRPGRLLVSARFEKKQQQHEAEWYLNQMCQNHACGLDRAFRVNANEIKN